MKVFEVLSKLPSYCGLKSLDEKIKLLTRNIYYCKSVKSVAKSKAYQDGIKHIIDAAIIQFQKRYRNPELNHNETAAALSALESINNKIEVAIKELPKFEEQLTKLEERNDSRSKQSKQ